MSQKRGGSSGVVVPQPLKWHRRFLAAIIYRLIELIAFTVRLRWDPATPLERVAPGQQAIFCVWHNRLALSMVVYRDHICATGRTPRLAALVSASKDGAILARVLEHFNVEPVRGSSSRRGPQALRELTSCAERGCDLAITPDGPRGPRYVVQPGIISLAQLTGLPIVPISYHYNRKISLKSWDRFQIPLPFSRGIMRVGHPILVPRDASEQQRETLRLDLEITLQSMTVD
jgi:lysophospholipid acyltransferase (LPLAT)-like uncharacterized protein